jgi:D-glycero-D-manno-heptose 1,7-bisphosphate phosphatase
LDKGVTILRCDGVEGRFNGNVDQIALFDRDGVLNIDHGYVSKVEDFEWVIGAREILDQCRSLGMGIAVITNQSGIGRGYYSEVAFVDLMKSVLPAGMVDLVVYCPHAPEADCPGRKPGGRMLEMALRYFEVDGSAAFFVGDKASDLGAADAAGIRGIRFEGGDLRDLFKDLEIS